MLDSPSMKAGDHERKPEPIHHFELSKGKLQRRLKSRHIAMISIGGVIGTGLFLGTATALKNGGPVGLLLGYSIVGLLCYAVMISVGEMISLLPVPGGHIKLAECFVDRSLSFTMGWLYWFLWTIAMPGELSAASVLIDYWDSKTSNAVWLAVCILVILTINLLGAGAYGEAEFIFASVKVVLIVGLIILGIVLDLGGGPNHDRIGFRYWKDPGAFAQFDGIRGTKGRFLGFWAVMTQAAFSFIGTEIVAIAAGETKNPRKSLPQAVKLVYTRIILFYIGGTAIIGLLVPFTDSRLNLDLQNAVASPFVIAIERAGIKGLSSLINACILTSAWSAASTDLYASSRTLYGLSVAGNAPLIFTTTSRNGLPYISVLFCSLFSLLSFMGIHAGPGKVFGWLVDLTAITGLVAWLAISVIYLRFYKGFLLQNGDRSKLPYASVFQPYAAWFSLVLCFVICILSGWKVFLRDSWDTATFVTTYLPFMLFPLVYVVCKIVKKDPFVKLSDMDFSIDLDDSPEIETTSSDELFGETKKVWWRQLFGRKSSQRV